MQGSDGPLNSKTGPHAPSPAWTRRSKDIVSFQSESANVCFSTCLQRAQKEPRDGVRWPLRTAAGQRVPFVMFACAPGDCPDQQVTFTVATAPLTRCAKDALVKADLHLTHKLSFSLFLLWQWSRLETAAPPRRWVAAHAHRHQKAARHDARADATDERDMRAPCS